MVLEWLEWHRSDRNVAEMMPDGKERHQSIDVNGLTTFWYSKNIPTLICFSFVFLAEKKLVFSRYSSMIVLWDKYHIYSHCLAGE